MVESGFENIVNRLRKNSCVDLQYFHPVNKRKRQQCCVVPLFWTPFFKISELIDSGKQSLTPYNVLINNNMGNTTLIMSLPIVDFVNLSEVANKKNISETASLEDEPIAQRPLDITHASRLSFYMMNYWVLFYQE